MITFPAIAISDTLQGNALHSLFVPAISNSMRNPEHSRLRRAAPSLRLDLPDAIAVRERVREGTGLNDGLALNHDSESPRYDSICGQALDIPEAHLVGQVLFGDTEVLTPFLYVSEPIGRSIWIQPR